MLNARQNKFVDNYLEGGRTITDCAIEAGYSAKTAAEQGSSLLRNPKIAIEIKKRRAEIVKTADMDIEKYRDESLAKHYQLLSKGSQETAYKYWKLYGEVNGFISKLGINIINNQPVFKELLDKEQSIAEKYNLMDTETVNNPPLNDTEPTPIESSDIEGEKGEDY